MKEGCPYWGVAHGWGCQWHDAKGECVMGCACGARQTIKTRDCPRNVRPLTTYRLLPVAGHHSCGGSCSNTA